MQKNGLRALRVIKPSADACLLERYDGRTNSARAELTTKVLVHKERQRPGSRA